MHLTEFSRLKEVSFSVPCFFFFFFFNHGDFVVVVCTKNVVVFLLNSKTIYTVVPIRLDFRLTIISQDSWDCGGAGDELVGILIGFTFLLVITMVFGNRPRAPFSRVHGCIDGLIIVWVGRWTFTVWRGWWRWCHCCTVIPWRVWIQWSTMMMTINELVWMSVMHIRWFKWWNRSTGYSRSSGCGWNRMRHLFAWQILWWCNRRRQWKRQRWWRWWVKHCSWMLFTRC